MPFSVSEHCLDEPLAHLIESTEESGQLTVRDMPPDHVAHKVRTCKDVSQHLLFSFLTVLSFIRVLTLAIQPIHTVER